MGVSPAKRKPATNPDIRDEPAYTSSDAARYLKLPLATLRSWFAGREYTTRRGARHWGRLIEPASESPLLLSFWNLIEAHVLWALRVDHKIPVPAVRAALAYAERDLGIKRLLLRKELRTSAQALFLQHYGQLIDLSASGQLALAKVLEAHLARVEWDARKFPVRLYPFGPTGDGSEPHLVAIDPAVAFGRPVLPERGVTTAVLADRIDAGESLAHVAADYDLTVNDVERAIVYERAA